MPKGIKGSGKPRNLTPVVKEERVMIFDTTPVRCVDVKEDLLKSILLSIVDALHDKDGDAATWKPIRDKIEAL